MKRIDNISSIDGRLLLHDIFHKLHFERQRSNVATLFILWRICTSNVEVKQYTNKDITILHKLGILRGTEIWLEEIVNRFYFSVVQSFVYFGAAILLILLGINNFSDKVDSSIVIYGIGFEAIILIFMFFIMLYSPNEDIANMNKNEEDDLEKEILNEIGEISKDFAITSAQLDKITDHLLAVTNRQNELISLLLKVTQNFSDLTNPNPQMIDTMKQSNEHLAEFNNQITTLIQTTKQFKQDEVQSLVRKELEKFFTDKLNK